jgi:hypothetical protein
MVYALVTKKETPVQKRKTWKRSVLVRGQPHGLISLTKTEFVRILAKSGLKKPLHAKHNGKTYPALAPVDTMINQLEKLEELRQRLLGKRKEMPPADRRASQRVSRFELNELGEISKSIQKWETHLADIERKLKTATGAEQSSLQKQLKLTHRMLKAHLDIYELPELRPLLPKGVENVHMT